MNAWSLSQLSIKLADAGVEWTRWTHASVSRDLQNISGGFELEYIDDGRIAQSLPDLLMPPPFFQIVRAGMACIISIDGETVLDGYIDDVNISWEASSLRASITGRDKTGDLVDCAALPDGPSEFRKVDLLTVARTVCAPYGITASADVDIGETFERLALAPHETAMAFLEKGARQRSVLLVSDGIGGLLLTRGGTTRGAAPLTRPGNIAGGGLRSTWRTRFSDYYVKGQTDTRRATAGGAPALSSLVVPPSSGYEPNYAVQTTARSTTLMTGHARDPEITRYRPTVRLTRSQSGMSTTQEQAEWALRVARGQADVLTYTVLEWRGNGELWRPNTRVQVTDPYADLDKEMLIAGVHFTYGEDGQKTQLRLVGVTAYDRINEAQRRRQRVISRPTAAGSIIVPELKTQ